MTTINLLPWREEQRKRQLQQFLAYGLIAAVIVIFLCVLVRSYYAGILSDQYQANTLLQTEITTMDNVIQEVRDIREKKNELTNRMQVVYHLETNRSEVVTMFDEFVRTLPSGIYVTQLSKKGDEITVIGKAESNTRVSELMKNIASSKAFKNPRLTEIKSNDKDNPDVRYFEVKMQRQATGDNSEDNRNQGASS